MVFALKLSKLRKFFLYDPSFNPKDPSVEVFLPFFTMSVVTLPLAMNEVGLSSVWTWEIPLTALSVFNGLVNRKLVIPIRFKCWLMFMSMPFLIFDGHPNW